MSDRDAPLAAVRANPEDDTPRLYLRADTEHAAGGKALKARFGNRVLV